MTEIADRYGLTREAISLVCRKAGIDAVAVRVAHRETARRAEWEELHAAAAVNAVPCKVCGKPNVRAVLHPAGGHLTCSPLCAEAWHVLRIHLDEKSGEKHRRAVAVGVLRNPEKHSAAQVELSRKIVDGTAPPKNRTYIVAGSRAAHYVELLGLDLPVGPPPKEETFRCAATNLTKGGRCARRVRGDGDVCHIHKAHVPA